MCGRNCGDGLGRWTSPIGAGLAPMLLPVVDCIVNEWLAEMPPPVPADNVCAAICGVERNCAPGNVCMACCTSTGVCGLLAIGRLRTAEAFCCSVIPNVLLLGTLWPFGRCRGLTVVLSTTGVCGARAVLVFGSRASLSFIGMGSLEMSGVLRLCKFGTGFWSRPAKRNAAWLTWKMSGRLSGSTSSMNRMSECSERE